MTDKQDKCVWCGKTYNEHRDKPLENGAVPKMGCTGLKSGFYAKRPELLGWIRDIANEMFPQTVKDNYSMGEVERLLIAVGVKHNDILQQERQRWVAELEGKKIPEPTSSEGDDGFNQGLQTAINLINGEKE